VDKVIIKNHQHYFLLIDYFILQTAALWLYFK